MRECVSALDIKLQFTELYCQLWIIIVDLYDAKERCMVISSDVFRIELVDGYTSKFL